MFVSVLLCVFVFSSTHYEARTRLWRKVLRRDEVKKNQFKLQDKTQLNFHAYAAFPSYGESITLWKCYFQLGLYALHHLNFQVEEKHLEVL